MSNLEITILNGPNLNLLGTRQPEVYGTTSLHDIEQACQAHAAAHHTLVHFFQDNSEGALIERIHQAHKQSDAIIINAAAYSHTSIALHDALTAGKTPAIELHLSNVYQRETFRHHSYVSRAVKGLICGFGAHGYILAIDAALQLIKQSTDHQ